MKPTQRKDLFTTIKGTIVSFFAITMFVALGVGLFLGIHWLAGSMHAMAAEQIRDGHAHDIEITFPYGLTDEDIQSLKDSAVEGELEVEAGYLSFQGFKNGDRTATMRVGTLPEAIDTFVEVEGTLPQKEDEIAVDKATAQRFNVRLGDTINFVPDGPNGKGMRYLKRGSFKVAALVVSPAFLSTSASTYGMSTSGSVDGVTWVVPAAFNEFAFLDGKPYVVIRSKALSNLDPFGDEYRSAVAELEKNVTTLGKGLGQNRLNQIHSLANALDENMVRIADRSTTSLEEINQRYDEGQLDEEEYNAAIQQLVSDTALQIRQTDETGGMSEEDSLAMAELAMPALSTFADLGLGSGTLVQLREGLANMVDYSWIVLSRTYNGGLVLMEGFCNITANLRWSMASLFLIVGLLVCYSALSRIVHEQVARIGTKKALGFSKKEINSLFLSYAGLCVVLGIVLGVLVAVFVVEAILLGKLGSRFILPLAPFVNVTDIVLIGALEMVLILAATWLAVSGVLKRHTVDLLAGERPPSAKTRFYEKWAIWQRIGLLAQITINNCVNDKRRVVGTLIGVAGCTALIACAIMLNDNVMRSYDRQYESITNYDAIASVEAESDAAAMGAQTLEDAGMDSAEVFQRSLTLRQPDDSLSVATVVVPMDAESFERLVHVIPIGTAPATAGKGVWVSEAYKEHLGAQVGDMVTLVDIAGNSTELPIEGFFEWHVLSHQIIVPQDLYEESFGVKASTNKLLVNTNGKSVKEVDVVLKPLSGYQNVRDDKLANKQGYNEFSGIARIVVLVYLALAVVMAACVLLNLDFMFVNEKKRELIVLMICGFSRRQAKGYIWHDSVALTALGIVLGLLLGSSVGGLTVRSIELPNASFLHGVSPVAMVVGAVGTVVLAAGALLIAMRRIDRMELTDINRF